MSRQCPPCQKAPLARARFDPAHHWRSGAGANPARFEGMRHSAGPAAPGHLGHRARGAASGVRTWRRRRVGPTGVPRGRSWTTERHVGAHLDARLHSFGPPDARETRLRCTTGPALSSRQRCLTATLACHALMTCRRRRLSLERALGRFMGGPQPNQASVRRVALLSRSRALSCGRSPWAAALACR
jgi:hypothetical protein